MTPERPAEPTAEFRAARSGAGRKPDENIQQFRLGLSGHRVELVTVFPGPPRGSRAGALGTEILVQALDDVGHQSLAAHHARVGRAGELYGARQVRGCLNRAQPSPPGSAPGCPGLKKRQHWQ